MSTRCCSNQEARTGNQNRRERSSGRAQAIAIFGNAMEHRVFFLSVMVLVLAAGESTAQHPSTRSTPGGAWRTLTTDDGLPSNQIRCVGVFAGETWVGTDRGLALLQHGQWKSWTRENGLPGRTIAALTFDHVTSTVWMGTWGDGLIRFSGGRFKRFDQMNSGLAGNLVFDVAYIGGRVWAATNAGLSVYDPRADEWSLHFARRADARVPVITRLAIAGNGLFASAWHGDLWSFDVKDREWRAVTTEDAPDSSVRRPSRSAVHDLVALSANSSSLIAASMQRVLYLDATGQSTGDGIFGHIHGFVSAIARPSESETWIGSTDGLTILGDRSTNPAPAALSNRPANGKSHDSLVIENDVRTPSAWLTLRDSYVRCIAIHGRRAWVGTTNGLYYAPDRTRLNRSGPAAFETRSEESRVDDLTRLPASSASASDVLASADRSRSARVAILGPRNRTVRVPGTSVANSWRYRRVDEGAAQLAVERFNASRHVRSGVAISLATAEPGYKNYGWVTPEDDFPGAIDAGVVGLVAAIRDHDERADAVAFRSEIPIVNLPSVSGGEGQVAEVNPWVFACNGNEPLRHGVLIDYLVKEKGLTRFAILRTSTSAHRFLADWWHDQIRRRGCTLVADKTWTGGAGALSGVIADLETRDFDVLLTWADADQSNAILAAMRERSMQQVVLVGYDAVTEGAITSAFDSVGDVVALRPQETTERFPYSPTFAADYAARNFGRGSSTSPSWTAVQSFHAVDHLLTAVDRGGADRDQVRCALEQMEHSALGEAHYERLYPLKSITIVRLVDGRWVIQAIDASD